MQNNNETFSYTYSAKQQEEVKRIREKYIPLKESKMETLRKLDKNVGRPGTIASITVGLVSSLVFGTGMACIIEMTDLFLIGIAVGIVGLIGMLLAFPIYRLVTTKQRKKLMPQIMQLSEDLMQLK